MADRSYSLEDWEVEENDIADQQVDEELLSLLTPYLSRVGQWEGLVSISGARWQEHPPTIPITLLTGSLTPPPPPSPWQAEINYVDEYPRASYDHGLAEKRRQERLAYEKAHPITYMGCDYYTTRTKVLTYRKCPEFFAFLVRWKDIQPARNYVEQERRRYRMKQQEQLTQLLPFIQPFQRVEVRMFMEAAWNHWTPPETWPVGFESDLTEFDVTRYGFEDQGDTVLLTLDEGTQRGWLYQDYEKIPESTYEEQDPSHFQSFEFYDPTLVKVVVSTHVEPRL